MDGLSLGEETPFVSVGVPTYNRAALLATCLEALVDQDYPPDRYEVIVVDDGSRDATRAVVERIASRAALPAVHYRLQAHQGGNTARNAVLALAGGDPVCFTDDDTAVSRTWVSALAAASHHHPTAGCLGGRVQLRLEASPPRMCGAEPLGEAELDLGDQPHEVQYVWGANMAVRRHAIEAVGAFSEHRLTGNDEVEWMDRLFAAHVPVLYVPDALVWHRRTADELRLSFMLRRRFLRGVGQSITYYNAGVAYDVRQLVRSVPEQVRHAVGRRCAVGWLRAAQDAGRLVGLASRMAADRLHGRRRSLLPPPG